MTRCLELSEYYEDHHRLPAPETIGLPPRVLSIYKSWSDERQKSTTRHQTRLRLARPTLVLDPWGNGPVIELPAQTLSSDLLVESGRWLIGDMQSSAERPFSLYPRWSEAGWETEAYQFELPGPGNYSVTLETNNGKESHTLRTWYFHWNSLGENAL